MFWYTPSIKHINSFSELGVVDNVYVNSAEPEPDAVNKSVVKTEPEPPDIVTLSLLASVVITIPAPASNVNVSFSCSATTLDCPLTAIVPNESPPPPILPHAPAAYPSNSDVVVLYLNCPKAAVGLCAVVPFGTLIASVLEPTSKLTPGEVVPIPSFPSSDLNTWIVPAELENCSPYVDVDWYQFDNTLSLVLILPFTSNASTGLVVPIPTRLVDAST